MGRVYTALRTVAAKTGTPPLDLISLATPSTGSIKILAAGVGQSGDYGDAEAEGLVVTLSRATSAGSGGSNLTPSKHLPGDPASTVAAHAEATTPASSQTPIIQDPFNVQIGYQYRPTPDEQITVPASSFFVMGLAGTTAIEDSLLISFWITYEELY